MEKYKVQPKIRKQPTVFGLVSHLFYVWGGSSVLLLMYFLVNRTLLSIILLGAGIVVLYAILKIIQDVPLDRYFVSLPKRLMNR